VQWALQLNSIPATAETWKLKVEWYRLVKHFQQTEKKK
jgi:hypothetical protein